MASTSNKRGLGEDETLTLEVEVPQKQVAPPTVDVKLFCQVSIKRLCASAMVISAVRHTSTFRCRFRPMLSQKFVAVTVKAQGYVVCVFRFYRASAYWRSRVSILTSDIDIANLSVRPSVSPSLCLSVRYVPVPYTNGLTYRHSFFHHTVAQSFCFYQHQWSNIFTKFRRGHPLRGR